MSEYTQFDPENPDAGFPAKFSHFILHKRLGAGGMGTTFLAEDESLGRNVAIKIMQKELGADAGAFEAFKNEAQSAARLNHPNVAQIYSFGQEGGCPYLEMELVPGGDLAHIMESSASLDPAFVLRVGLEIAQGLKAAEDGGLFHGDVKPDNILFDEKGIAKLVDFGIASRAGKGASDEVWGTPYYIAPEKVQKKTDSARSDIYSLGATLYHAIAGVPPYDGETPMDVVKARFNGSARPVNEVRPEVEPEVARIVSRMMSNDLFLRYPNYNSLIGDLNKYLSTAPAFRTRGPVGAVREAVKSATGAVSEAKPEETAPGAGKKKFVIQKGQLEGAAAATGSFAAAKSSDAPSGTKKQIKFNLKGAAAPAAPDAAQSRPADEEDSEAARRRRAARTVRVMVTVFSVLVGVIVLGVVGFFVKKVMDSRNGERQIAQYKIDAESCQTQIEELAPQFEKTLARIRNFDEQAKKKYEEVADIIRKATDIDFEMPDLEPPPEETAPPPEEAAAAAAAPTDILTALLAFDKIKKNNELVGALGAFVGAHPEARADQDLLAKITEKMNDPVFGSNDALLKGAVDGILSGYTPPAGAAPAESAPDAAPEPEPEPTPEPGPEPEPAPAVELTPEEKAEAEKRDQARRDYETLRAAASSVMDESARVIRAALRRGEAFKARAEDADERLDFKPTDGPFVIYENRKAVLDERLGMLKQMKGLVADCEKAFKGGVSHGVAAVTKAARPINARRLREAEEAARARELAEKEAKERAEIASAEAKCSEEVSRIRDLCARNQGFIDSFEYDKFRRQLARMEAELTTDGAREELSFVLKRIDAVESLRKWVLDDLRKNGEVKRGWRNRYDIIGVSLSAPELRLSGNQPNVPIDRIGIGDWNALFSHLLEARPPTRHGLDSIERGTQLFNAAVFCYLHGKGDERALERSGKLAKESFKYRSALENDVKKYLPFYVDDASADGDGSAASGGGDAFWN